MVNLQASGALNGFTIGLCLPVLHALFCLGLLSFLDTHLGSEIIRNQRFKDILSLWSYVPGVSQFVLITLLNLYLSPENHFIDRFIDGLLLSALGVFLLNVILLLLFAIWRQRR